MIRGYAYGETILTVWPPPVNFSGLNAVSRLLHVDDNGDGRGDRTVTVPMPIFHVLGLLSDLGDRYWVLPEQKVGGHRVAGFASRDGRGVVRVVLYTHQPEDTQSRSEAAFEVTLALEGLAGQGAVRVEQTAFDQNHNSPFKLARALRDRPATGGTTDPAALGALVRNLEGSDRAAQRRALESVQKLDPSGRQAAAGAILKLAGQEQDTAIRDLAKDVIKSLFAPMAYARAEIEQIQKMCECHPSGTATVARDADGRFRVSTRLAANGCAFLTIERVN